MGTWLADLHLTSPSGGGPGSQPPSQSLTQLLALLPVASKLRGGRLLALSGRLGQGKEPQGKLAQISSENEEELVFSPLPLQINI